MYEQKEIRPSIKLFYSYAPEDADLCDLLEKHLSPLQTEGLITTWNNRQVLPGMDRDSSIYQHLETAGIILLLISAHFFSSCNREMQHALNRDTAKEAVVIPVLLRPCHWNSSPIARLQPLPHNGKAVTQWGNQDEAYLDIVKGIRETVEQFSPAGFGALSTVPPRILRVASGPSPTPNVPKQQQSQKSLEDLPQASRGIVPTPKIGEKPQDEDSFNMVPSSTELSLSSTHSNSKRGLLIVPTIIGGLLIFLIIFLILLTLLLK